MSPAELVPDADRENPGPYTVLAARARSAFLAAGIGTIAVLVSAFRLIGAVVGRVIS